jgi:hypothetical protein
MRIVMPSLAVAPLAAALCLTAGLAAPASAQNTAGGSPRWNAWAGCWVSDTRASSEPAVTRCVIPSADGVGARMVTLADDSVVLDESLRATGQPESMQQQACTGQRTARWAKAGQRLFITSTLSCAAQPAVSTSGVSALVDANTWLDVQVARVEGVDRVRTRRFHRAAGTVPQALSTAMRGLVIVREPVPPVTPDDIVEASSVMVAPGVEAWLAESRTQVRVDRRTLTHLADGNVAPRVIDLLVAMAYPDHFDVRRSDSYGGGGFLDAGAGLPLALDAWGRPFGFDSPAFGAFGILYADPMSLTQPGGYVYLTVPEDTGGSNPAAHGRVVNGQGYTQVQTREPVRAAGVSGNGASSSGAGADSSGNSGSSSGSSGASSSGASPDGYSSGGGTSTGLTAVPR